MKPLNPKYKAFKPPEYTKEHDGTYKEKDMENEVAKEIADALERMRPSAARAACILYLNRHGYAVISIT